MNHYRSSSSLLHDRLYWREQYVQFSSETVLPLDYRRSPNWQEKYRTITYCLSPALSDTLFKLTQSQPLSLLTLLSSAWAVLLHLMQQESDIVFATPVYLPVTEDNDLRKNVVCIRLKIDSHGSFKQLLIHTRTALLNAFQHQHLEYEEFLTEIGLQKKRNRSIPFSHLLYSPEIQLPPDKKRYKSDLFIRFEKQSNQLAIIGEYNEELFRDETIKFLFLHVEQILASIPQKMDLPLSSMDSLISSEKEWMASSLNALEANLKIPCLHHVFEQQAKQYPHHIALETITASMTYAELNAKANRLAHHLIQTYGVKPGGFIGFLGERSLEYCLAVLAILKAGCAFVPFDLHYPIKRLSTLLEESPAQIILATASTLADFKSKGERPLERLLWVEIDTELSLLKDEEQNPSTDVTPQHCAYLIHTSGSTGKPKKVLVRHDGKMNHILSTYRTLSFDEHSNCLFSAPISADISIWQMLIALLCGGKTVIIENKTLFDFAQLEEYLRNKRVHYLQLVPTFAKAFLSYLNQQQSLHPLPLKCLILSGEEVSVQLLNGWFALFPNIPILNAYGPTEASDIVCQELYTEPVHPKTNHLWIGRPIENVQAFILNSYQQPQPFYAPGEIYLAGVAVGEGYWNEKERTLQAFIQNPFNPCSQRKWYRTGDYGRLHPDGKIEYLGRIDSQVKIRGFRVELQEIEAHLLSHPAVQESKVCLRSIQDQEFLYAYVVLASNQQTVAQTLKEHLSRYLPDYMIPQSIHILEQLPLLPNGKIDTLNLPISLQQENFKEKTPPRNEQERKLSLLLSQVIGIPQEGIDMQASFFDLGGTSIHLMALKYHIKEQFHCEIPIDRLFRMQTIVELAQELSGNI